MRTGMCRGVFGEIGACDVRAAPSRLDFDRLDLDLLLRTDKAEPLLVRDLEQSAHAAQARHRNGERAVGSGIAEMRVRADGDDARIDALAQEFPPYLRFERRADRRECGETVIGERRK